MEFLQRRDRLATITNEGIDFVPKSNWDWNQRTHATRSIVDGFKIVAGTLIGMYSTRGMGEEKGEKIIERLQVEPKFPGGCDHLI